MKLFHSVISAVYFITSRYNACTLSHTISSKHAHIFFTNIVSAARSKRIMENVRYFVCHTRGGNEKMT